ncbi:MAG: hypothetical protein J5666_02200 [Bacilli bacterium]|nr:hypothetical protein [Bacilli bacterium]
MEQITEFFKGRFNSYNPDMFVWIILVALMPLLFLLGIMIFDKPKKGSASYDDKMEIYKFYLGATTFCLFEIAVYCAAVYMFGYRPAIGHYALPNIPFFIIMGTSLFLGLVSLVMMYVVEGIHRNAINDPGSKRNIERRRKY